MIYLASPYSAFSETLEKRRFLQTREFVMRHIAEGVVLFSPIVYCHQFKTDFGHPGDAEAWRDFNSRMLICASGLWVLKLTGWDASVGVAWEIKLASELELPIVYKEAPVAPL